MNSTRRSKIRKKTKTKTISFHFIDELNDTRNRFVKIFSSEVVFIIIYLFFEKNQFKLCDQCRSFSVKIQKSQLNSGPRLLFLFAVLISFVCFFFGRSDQLFLYQSYLPFFYSFSCSSLANHHVHVPTNQYHIY